MCIDNAAVKFDTGYLDTHLDLGINTPSKDRVQFRGIATCAVVTTKGFTSDWLNSTQADLPASSDPTPGEVFLEFYYGTSPAHNVTPTFFFSNSTFVYAGYDSVTPNVYLLGQVITISPLAFLALLVKVVMPLSRTFSIPVQYHSARLKNISIASFLGLSAPPSKWDET
jgi:hypothetical protein